MKKNCNKRLLQILRLLEGEAVLTLSATMFISQRNISEATPISMIYFLCFIRLFMKYI